MPRNRSRSSRIVASFARLELLEPRLAPGDAILGPLVGWSLLAELDTLAPIDLSLRRTVARAEQREAPVEQPATATADPDPEKSVAKSLTPWSPWPRTHLAPNPDEASTFGKVKGYLATWPHDQGNVPACDSACHLATSHTSSPGASFSNSRLQTAVGGTPFPRPVSTEVPFAGPGTPNESLESTRESSADFGALPFYFEQNMGQADRGFDFVARGPGYTLGLSATEAVMAIPQPEVGGQRSEVGNHITRAPVAGAPGWSSPVDTQHSALSTQHSLVRMQIAGGDPNARAAGVSPLVTKVNYFLGNDPNQWHTNIPTFAKVQYDNVYPGIDLVYYGTSCSAENSEVRGRKSEVGSQRSEMPGGLSTQHSALSTQHCFEYDFIVAPGADPNQIQLSFTGADSVTLDAAGNLNLQAGDTILRQNAPYIYQEVNGARQQAAGEFRIQNSECTGSTDYRLLTTDYSSATDYCLLSTVYFDVGAYDVSRRLVIDPLVLSYSTYLGAPGPVENDFAYDIAVDARGNAYVTGDTRSIKFPTTEGAFDQTYGGGDYDTFVAKLAPDGSELVYATFLGGTSGDDGRAIAVDADGNAYVTGSTHSRNFPTTSGAFDRSYNRTGDVYVTKLNAVGSDLVYSTFLGGTGNEAAFGIAVGDTGSAYLTGGTTSVNFPTSPDAFDSSFNGGLGLGDAYIAMLGPDGGALGYSTYIGGSEDDAGRAIVVNASGDAFIIGSTQSPEFPVAGGAFDESHNGEGDAFVAKLNGDGSALLYSTFLGGTESDGASGIVVDDNGNAYVTGGTHSEDFPTTPGAFDTVKLPSDVSDGFVTKLTASGSALAYSTFLTGASVGGTAITVDTDGNAYATGVTLSGFPTTSDAFDKTFNGGFDIYFIQLNAAGSALIYSTYLGGAQSETPHGIAIDAIGNVYLCGETTSGDFPTTPNALKRRHRPFTLDGFVTKFGQI